jgi:FKBP-type peptidyl-prolyl cis-trans isomerase (trigger factor)
MLESVATMNIEPGIELVEETEGVGKATKKGDRVVYNIRIFLNRGDEVPINENQAKHGLRADILRQEGEKVFVDHQTILGKRRSIAGIERSLIGMKPGGYRKVRVSPHLTYGEKGIPGLIPANAVLVIEIWLREAHADA